MGTESLIGTILAIITALTTYQGLKHHYYQEKYLFHIDHILIDKQYYRLISSGFLHGNWLHFAFNMFALVSFALSIEILLGIPSFLLIYFLSMLGGNLLALYIHRNHGNYSAVGASGAISGILAASIILFPDSEIGLLFIPFHIKSWIFGLLFIAISLLGIKSQRDNIGHEAHLGGLLTGIIVTLLISPAAFISNWWIPTVMLVPIIIFLFVIIKRPDILLTDQWNLPKVRIKNSKKSPLTLDRILEKIKKSGIESLTDIEKEMLDKYSED